MSSSPTDLTSTTGSSTCSPSPAERAGTAVIACGALARSVATLADEHSWAVDVYPLPPLLHNHPEQIAASVEPLLVDLLPRYDRVAIGYADCGTYGALDDLCDRYGVRRLAGLHCYDVLGGVGRMRTMLDEQPGTYVLTDFLVRSFERTVVRELGLDRYPDLRDAYFGHYTRVVWLTERPDDDLRAQATRAAGTLGVPLTEIEVGLGGLERALRPLVA